MKKSVVTLIAIIYVSSIVLVTFFGLKHNTFFEDIKVSEVKIVNDDVSYHQNNDKFVVLTQEPYVYKIDYEIYPENAVNQKVKFHIVDPPEGVTVSEDGTVTMPSTDYLMTVTVYVVSEDSNGAYDKIDITVWPYEFSN